MLAEHALKTTSGQADQAAERLRILRRAQQRHSGWMEANDADLRVRERAVAREDAWRRRVDQRMLALDPPGWLLAKLGPVPVDPQERAVWRVAAAELDGYRRAYGLDHPGLAEHGGGRVARAGRAAAPATAPTALQTGEARGSAGRRSRSERARQPFRARRDPVAAEDLRRVEAGRLLGAEPRRAEPGRRRDWQTAWAALERLADHYRRGRDDRHRPLERAGRLPGPNTGRQERDGR